MCFIKNSCGLEIAACLLLTMALLPCTTNGSLVEKLIDSASRMNLETELVSDLGIRCGEGELVCHEYINTVRKMNTDPKFRRTVPLVITERDENGDIVENRRRKRSLNVQCPQFNQQYFNTHHNVSQLSLSPWVLEENIDNERNPRILLTAVNLCTGCMSRRDDGSWYENLNLRSLPMRHRVAFTYRGQPNRVVWRVINLGYRCGL